MKIMYFFTFFSQQKDVVYHMLWEKWVSICMELEHTWTQNAQCMPLIVSFTGSTNVLPMSYSLGMRMWSWEGVSAFPRRNQHYARPDI